MESTLFPHSRNKWNESCRWTGWTKSMNSRASPEAPLGSRGGRTKPAKERCLGCDWVISSPNSFASREAGETINPSKESHSVTGPRVIEMQWGSKHSYSTRSTEEKSLGFHTVTFWGLKRGWLENDFLKPESEDQSGNWVRKDSGCPVSRFLRVGCSRRASHGRYVDGKLCCWWLPRTYKLSE